MNNEDSNFQPVPPDASGAISWVHIGDLHMTRAGEQNHRDLSAIVQRVNRAFAGSISFVYLPGDNADDGSRTAYAVVRSALDQLSVPWTAVVGDHDVHEESHGNFMEFMTASHTGSFVVGAARFLRLNAFDTPRPDAFAILPAQLDWIRSELEEARSSRQVAVMLMHCYPTDLKQGGDALSALLREFHVGLVEMGHTHYNELSNDGTTLYAATRSTGQIEEGPVGYSVTTIDGNAFSWRFFPLAHSVAVMITSPADARLVTERGVWKGFCETPLRIRARAWSEAGIERVEAAVLGQRIPLQRIPGTATWEGLVSPAGSMPPVLSIQVEAFSTSGERGTDTIHAVISPAAFHPSARAEVDQDNALSAWPEHGLLGTQLGPNKNGRKW